MSLNSLLLLVIRVSLLPVINPCRGSSALVLKEPVVGLVVFPPSSFLGFLPICMIYFLLVSGVYFFP